MTLTCGLSPPVQVMMGPLYFVFTKAAGGAVPGSLQQRRGTGGGQSTIFVSPCGTIQSEISCNAGTNWDNLRGAFNKKRNSLDFFPLHFWMNQTILIMSSLVQKKTTKIQQKSLDLRRPTPF